jgi:hypothetical protein
MVLELAIPVRERLQIHALDCAATGTDKINEEWYMNLSKK